ncbi:MAG: hypothetical protein WC365_03190 [Candidatus Babeliales bacterium]|jgi:hypothetical protein
MKSRTINVIVIGCIVIAVAFGVVTLRRVHKPVAGQPWMTIFVHGSFGSLLGFLNISDVLSDRIYGTEYQQITSKIRNDGFFYRHQPILKQGLIAFEPSFDPHKAETKKFAIYPIVKAYEVINEKVFPEEGKTYFYAFGWSGLLSQTNRRLEAIRFYNALCAELARLRSKGIYPKVRIITHSHGGNLALNLGAVQKLFSMPLSDTSAQFSPDQEENESLHDMAAVMRNLPSKEGARTRTQQEIWDYIPVDRSLVIDELIMYGSPVQAETEPFCQAPIFKKVFNIYSGEDWVQRFDWVSSKKTTISKQRLMIKENLIGSGARVVQARIMLGRRIMNGKLVIDRAEDVAVANQVYRGKEPSIIDALMSGKNVFVRKSKDPTHKEMWFLMWSEDPEGYSSPLFPLPAVVMTPLIVKALEETKNLVDADVNIDIVGNNVVAYVMQHDQDDVKGTCELDASVLTLLQQQTMKLKPSREVYGDEFNAIYRYLG